MTSSATREQSGKASFQVEIQERASTQNVRCEGGRPWEGKEWGPEDRSVEQQPEVGTAGVQTIQRTCGFLLSDRRLLKRGAVRGRLEGGGSQQEILRSSSQTMWFRDWGACDFESGAPAGAIC